MTFFILILCAYGGGRLFARLKIPAGMLLGSMVITGILVGGLDFAPASQMVKYMAQTAAGMYIGCSSSKEDWLQLRTFYKPAAILTISLLIINLIIGFALWGIGFSDLLTALMCAVPGGISDVTIIASDMGCDAAQVLTIHLFRLVLGIGLFPWLVSRITPPMPQDDTCSAIHHQAASVPPQNPLRFALLCLICAIGAWAGLQVGLPSGCLMGAMLVAFAVQLTNFQVHYPPYVRRLAQVASGIYIGGLVDPSLFYNWQLILLSLVICTVTLVSNALVFSHILNKTIHVPLREGMLMLTPAGASDMALISADVGVHSTRLIMMQLYRFIIACAFFPQIWFALVQWLAL